MPQSRNAETDPRAYFGNKLRGGRIAAGFTSAAALATELHVERSVIAKAETGERPPKPDSDLLAAWCEVCTLDPGHMSELATLADAVEDRVVPVWFADYLDVEIAAHTLRTWQPIVIPGLLQTADYARTLFAAMGFDPDRADDMTAERIKRQSILNREDPPNLWVVLDETVLRRHVGSSTIMHEALMHIADMGERPNIGIQVVPAICGANAGCVGALTIASVNDKPDVLLTEAVQDQTTQHAPLLRTAHEIFDRVRCDALPRVATLELVREVAERWKTQTS